MFKKLRRNLKNFSIYRKVIKENRETLEKDYNVRIDNIWRLYTIYSINPRDYEAYGEDKLVYDNLKTAGIENVKRSDALINGEDVFQSSIKKEMTRLDRFLSSLGISELYGLSDKKRIDKYNYRIIIRYKFINTKFWANVLSYVGFATIIGIVTGLMLKK
jgi:hypothetical protein